MFCMCGAKTITGFKSQCIPRAFLCSKNLPPGYKADNLQKELDSNPPHWSARMATWTRCPIKHAQPETDVPLFKYLITLNP